jgi:hypothetical protein
LEDGYQFDLAVSHGRTPDQVMQKFLAETETEEEFKVEDDRRRKCIANRVDAVILVVDLEDLFASTNEDENSIAISGLRCEIKALRRRTFECKQQSLLRDTAC